MLQINTGKLFSTPVGLENKLKGILYANVDLPPEGVQTSAGSLYPTSEISGFPRTLIYDFIERIEISGPGAGVILSHGADYYLEDFSAVVSFALNCTCSRDSALVQRLTSGQAGLATRHPPSAFIRSVYDQKRYVQPAELDEFAQFVKHLLGLPRATYLAVIEAIRTYVTAMHRVADDLELAYTLIVAAGESLAQKFDGHDADWISMDASKRTAFDSALEGASADVAIKVQNAVLRFEHQALSRRFREFVIEHVSANYFVTDSQKNDRPAGRSELPELLKEAYAIRSKNVHELAQLPSELTWGHSYAETVQAERSLYLSLQGLSRLMREVIVQFTFKQKTVDVEPCSYLRDIPSIKFARLSPEIWVPRVGGDMREQGRDRFEGFLEILVHSLTHTAEEVLIGPLLKWIADNCANLPKPHRSCYVAICRICDGVSPDQLQPSSPELERLKVSDLKDCTPISLVVSSIIDDQLPWPVEQTLAVFRKYQSERHTKLGIRVPRLIEAGMALSVAEQLRKANDIEQCSKVIRLAADDFPESVSLRLFVDAFDSAVPINNSDILLPKQVQPSESDAGSAPPLES